MVGHAFGRRTYLIRDFDDDSDDVLEEYGFEDAGRVEVPESENRGESLLDVPDLSMRGPAEVPVSPVGVVPPPISTLGNGICWNTCEPALNISFQVSFMPTCTFSSTIFGKAIL